MEALTKPVKKAQAVILYQQKDITSALGSTLLSLTYSDKISGESDEVELRLEDAAGRWRSSWYPEKGDTLTIKIGYEGEPMLACGNFQIDEVEIAGPPDTVVIRALATGTKTEVRTQRSVAYEKQSLRQVAQQVASRNGLTLSGNVADLKFDRLTQHQETDVAFLNRIAKDFGYAFSVRGEMLVFHSIAELDAAGAVLKLSRGVLNSYSFKDKAKGIYRGCTVSYHDPKSGKLVTHTERAQGVEHGDYLKLGGKCENRAQAEARAKAALREALGVRTTGTLGLDGEPRLVSGNSVDLTDFGRLSGLYQIREARHQIGRDGGWSVEAEVQRVPQVRGR